MHPGFEKDYKYLLAKLIPRQFLSSNRIEGILDALVLGERPVMIREAFISLEELVKSGVFRKGEAVHREGEVSIEYTRKSNYQKITLVMSEREWRTLTARERTGGGIVPSVLANILSFLSLNNAQVSSRERIEKMLGLTGYILPDARAFFILFGKLEPSDEEDHLSLREAEEEDLLKSNFYRQALSTGRICTLIHPEIMYGAESMFGVDPEVKSIMLLPLRGGRTHYGILQIHVWSTDSPPQEAYTNFYLIAQGIVRYLENSRHFAEMVSIDTLTKVNNRNYYETQLPLEMERASRTQRCLGFLIMDIDDFKLFNDRYGHDTGDEVLKIVAHTIRRHLRKIDLLFRFGGEEFVALLPGAGREAAERTAERIREVVSQTGFKLEEGRILSITLTIGGCIYPVDAEREEDLFHKADQALLKAKSDGKNRVCFYPGKDD
ncbi:MAG: GGDEF domain-containing protein [Candidatus Krumholzibacteriota bacterium]|nr:GGDEF domain-containing protein [Candidatus Krumholzibacteriota bacterium]